MPWGETDDWQWMSFVEPLVPVPPGVIEDAPVDPTVKYYRYVPDGKGGFVLQFDIWGLLDDEISSGPVSLGRSSYGSRVGAAAAGASPRGRDIELPPIFSSGFVPRESPSAVPLVPSRPLRPAPAQKAPAQKVPGPNVPVPDEPAPNVPAPARKAPARKAPAPIAPVPNAPSANAQAPEGVVLDVPLGNRARHVMPWGEVGPWQYLSFVEPPQPLEVPYIERLFRNVPVDPPRLPTIVPRVPIVQEEGRLADLRRLLNDRNVYYPSDGMGGFRYEPPPQDDRVEFILPPGFEGLVDSYGSGVVPFADSAAPVLPPGVELWSGGGFGRQLRPFRASEDPFTRNGISRMSRLGAGPVGLPTGGGPTGGDAGLVGGSSR